jgi:hypothetical protein
MELIPYTGSPPSAQEPLQPGMVQGIIIILLAEDEKRLDLLAKIRRWFANRPEVVLVDRGSTDKQGYFFIILEWDGYAVDPLFIAILEEEDAIEDYTIYGRGN